MHLGFKKCPLWPTIWWQVKGALFFYYSSRRLPDLDILTSSGSKREEHCYVCLSEAKAWLTYLLKYSMVQSPSWEASWFAASQEIPRISRNPKVHYRTHKRPPPVHILGQPNPVHIPTFHLLEIRPNIIHPSMPRFPPWFPSLRFPPPRPYTPPSRQPYAPHAQPKLDTHTKCGLRFLPLLHT